MTNKSYYISLVRSSIAVQRSVKLLLETVAHNTEYMTAFHALFLYRLFFVISKIIGAIAKSKALFDIQTPLKRKHLHRSGKILVHFV